MIFPLAKAQNCTGQQCTFICMYMSCMFNSFTDSLLQNQSVTVQNAGRLKSPDGEVFLIKGYAYRPDDKEQGKLKVHLFGVPREGDCKQCNMIV